MSSTSSLRRLPSSDARLGDVLAELSARFAAGAGAHDAAASFPHENFAQLHTHGLTAQVVPREHGGGGAGLAQARRIVAASLLVMAAAWPPGCLWAEEESTTLARRH